VGRERTSRNQAECKCTGARLRRGACDSEFANSLLQGGALHSKMRPDELAKLQRQSVQSRELSCVRSALRASIRASLSRAFRAETERREVYGFTCTLASPVTNWIGRCCESLALTCTIDRVLVPGASALITMRMIVPVPLAPAVFGWRVAEMIA
jgi:hypothetical protein